MNKNIIETVVGFIVLAVAAIFVVIAYQSGTLEARKGDNYVIYAKFDRADGIKIGSEVRLSGVLVGKVNEMSLDHKTYLAVLKLSVEKGLQLPSDTQAEITGNFFGDKYVVLVPGAAEDMIPPEGTINYTQSSVSIEGLLGKFMFGGTK